MVEFIEDPANALKPKDEFKQMAEESQDDPKSHIEAIFAGQILGLLHPICAPEDQMFQLFTQAPLSTGYNLPGSLPLIYPIEPEMILTACDILIKRHDITRTSYHMGSSARAMKRISKTFMGDCHILNTEHGGTFGAFFQMDWSRPFQLGVVPARFFVCLNHNDRGKSTSEAQPQLYFCMHHVIADGDGQGIGMGEWELICNYLFRGFSVEATNEKLVPITVQFQDYAYWLQSLDARGLLLDELGVWFSGICSSAPPEILDIPLDLPRNRTFIPVGQGIKVGLDQDLLDPIMKVSPTTPYSLAFTFFTVAMCRLSQRSNIIVAIAYGTRPLTSLYPLIGSFLNMLPAHFSYYPSESLGTCLDRMSATQLTARKNCLAPFMTINNYVRSYNNPPFDPSRNPSYQSMLDMLPSGDEYNPPGLNGVLDLFGFVLAPVGGGGAIRFMECCWNSTITTYKSAVNFLNLAKASALVSASVAGRGPEALHSTLFPEQLASPEVGIKPTQGASMGKFIFKLNLRDEEHADAKDEDCEISLISGPEAEGVPDEYDFFRRSKKFLRHSGIMPTVNESHAFAPRYQQPNFKKMKGMGANEEAPQIYMVDSEYEKNYSEPQLNWVPTAAIASPSKDVIEGEIKFFYVKEGFGMIVPANGGSDVIFTTSSIPIKERPTKKNPVDLTGQKVTFTLLRGINEHYAAGITFLEETVG